MPTSAQHEGSVGPSDSALLLLVMLGSSTARFDVSNHVDQDHNNVCVMTVSRADAERARMFIKQEGQLLDGDVHRHHLLRLIDVKVNPSQVASEIIAQFFP